MLVLKNTLGRPKIQSILLYLCIHLSVTTHIWIFGRLLAQYLSLAKEKMKLKAVTAASMGVLAWGIDYYLVNIKNNVRYCHENAQNDLLGTFSQRKNEKVASIDHYRTFMDLSNGSDQRVSVEQLANAFFSSPLFLLQTKMMDAKPLTREEVDSYAFNVGDHLSEFTVIEKTDQEIVFRSDDGFLLWMKVVNDNGPAELNFGSGILEKSIVEELPFGVHGAMMNFHYIYSRYLLLQAKKVLANKLVNKC